MESQEQKTVTLLSVLDHGFGLSLTNILAIFKTFIIMYERALVTIRPIHRLIFHHTLAVRYCKTIY